MSSLSISLNRNADQEAVECPPIFSLPLPFGFFPIENTDEMDFYEDRLYRPILGILEDFGIPPRDIFYAFGTPADIMSDGQRTIFIAAPGYSDVNHSWLKAEKDIKELLSENGWEDVEVEMWPISPSFEVKLEPDHGLAISWTDIIRPSIADIMQAYCGCAWNDIVVHRLGCGGCDSYDEVTVTIKLDEAAERDQWKCASKEIRTLLNAYGYYDVNIRFEYTTFIRYTLFDSEI